MSVTTLAFKGEYHAPTLEQEFFPGDYYGNFILGTGVEWYTLDRLMIVRILMAAIIGIFFVVAMRRPKLVPTGLQNVAEYFLDFVRIYIAEEILGKKDGKRFLPILCTIFFLVFAMNLAAVIPVLNISPNARIGMPIVLAGLAYITFIYAGSKEYGFFKFVKSSVVIPNIPPALHIIVVPIEIFSTFVLRPVTLAIRLMAIMLAGHMVLVLLFGATNFFFWQLNGWTAMSALTVVGAILFTLFELLVIFLQAYIFALLTAVYIELSIHADSH